jgi:hypothetical protein
MTTTEGTKMVIDLEIKDAAERVFTSPDAT